MVDPEILDQAARVLGTKTYSATVNQALRETLRMAKLRGIFELVGTGAWSGNLGEMREDAPRRRRLKR